MGEKTAKKERSRAYPVMPLAEALVRIASINENLGIKGQYNRETIATGMGYNGLNGASARSVAALTHYGFLDRDKDLYSLSNLAQKYLMPIEDDDSASAKRSAALAPALFSEIYEAFKGQVIPKQFVNRLVQEFGIQQKAAPEVERIFKETMKTAGILQDNNILSTGTNVALQSVKQETQDEPTLTGPNTNLTQPQPSAPVGYLTVKLPSGLVIQYEQGLAPAFAFGQFGKVLKDLDEAVSGYLDSQQNVDKEKTNE